MRSSLTSLGAASPTRSTLLTIAVALALAGCGSSANSPPLPDLATKSQTPSGQPTMSSAQQKQAIDQMIAKRDAK